MGTPTAPDGPALHPSVSCLGFLLGTWVGEGTGSYPTVPTFSYREETTFSHSGQPFLTYSQRTWSTSDGRPLHVETGYWRAGPDGHVELVVAHPTGVAEVEEGTLRPEGGPGDPPGWHLELSSRFVGLTTTAKDVSTLSRSLLAQGHVLSYRLVMGAVGQLPRQHLVARLERAR